MEEGKRVEVWRTQSQKVASADRESISDIRIHLADRL